MKKPLLALAVCALSTASFAQGKDLKVAIDPTYEPFTFKQNGKPTGRSSASACLWSRAGTA
jgi:arginine/ornithine transport system substrate-binding protein